MGSATLRETCFKIVHHYDRVDAEIVVAILRKRIDDFKKFKDAIVTFLQKNNGHRPTRMQRQNANYE